MSKSDVNKLTRITTSAENLRILSSRLSDQLSPAEKRELSEAADMLDAAQESNEAWCKRWLESSHSEHVSSGNRALTLVNAQAKDGGLWFTANLAPEAYLQEALRKLHAAVEKDAAARPEASGELEETVAIPVKMLDELNDYADQVMRAKSLRSYTRATIGKFMRKLAALRASGGKAGK